MHTQTATTVTMAYPSLPASPTLTNPDMILPYGEYDSTPSPPQHAFRPSSSDDDWGISGRSDMQFSIGPPHAPLSPITSTTPIIYGNGTMLSDIGEVTEVESTPGRRLPGPAERRMLKQQALGAPIRSSPTMGYGAGTRRAKVGAHERKASMESTSTVKSERQAAELFKDFDDGVSVDDSVFQGDDEESVADSYVADSYVADSYTEEVIAAETQQLSRQESIVGRDEDKNSSAALSRRAEQILLNAKKRLNNMEGNLTRARSSLYTTPSGSMSSIHSSSPLSRSTPSPQDNSQQMAPQLGRQLNTSSESPKVSPGHSRVYSENSISSSLRTAPFPVRSASAAARYIGKGGMDSNHRSPTINHSPENAREEGRRSGLSSSLIKTSPPRAAQLEPLSEDDITSEFEADRASIRSSIGEVYLGPNNEPRGLTRSTSTMQMRGLRDQMHDLKGRLSVLRDRARDDTMKRRSLQSLRTPSPFTAAEEWYTTSKNYGDGGLSADAGVAHPPWNEETNETRGQPSDEKLQRQSTTRQVPEYASSDATSVYEDVSEGHNGSDRLDSHDAQDPEEEENYNAAAEDDSQEDVDDDVDIDYKDEMVNHEELDEYESDASMYHDTLTTPLSHEDREDAFDYEHFFLHSAMGTIGQQRHRRRNSVGSFSSEDSVETTRGPTTSNTVKERQSLGHLRSESTDSVSTTATFATATEELGSESRNEDDHDNFAVQQVTAPPLRTTTPVTAKRSTFGSPVMNGLPNDRQPTPEETSRPSSVIHDRDERNGSNIHRPSIASFESFESTGTTRSFPLVNKPKGQKSLTPDMRDSQLSVSIRSEPTISIERQGNVECLQPSPVHMLDRDDQILVERLVASLGKCVLGLQEAAQGSYESKVWRRRLDAARRILEGEEGPI